MTIKEWTTFYNYCFASQPSSVLLPILEDTTSKLWHIVQHSSVINKGDRFHICDKQYVHKKPFPNLEVGNNQVKFETPPVGWFPNFYCFLIMTASLSNRVKSVLHLLLSLNRTLYWNAIRYILRFVLGKHTELSNFKVWMFGIKILPNLWY